MPSSDKGNNQDSWGSRPRELTAFELDNGSDDKKTKAEKAKPRAEKGDSGWDWDESTMEEEPRPARAFQPQAPSITAVPLASEKRRTRHGEKQIGSDGGLLDSEDLCRQHLKLTEPLSGQLLANRYRIQDRLGEGAMAIVYRAKDEKSGKSVAVKTLKFHEPDVAMRFAREVEIHTRLKHENIVD